LKANHVGKHFNIDKNLRVDLNLPDKNEFKERHFASLKLKREENLWRYCATLGLFFQPTCPRATRLLPAAPEVF